LSIKNLPNGRDIGGLPAGGGKSTRTERLYRSGAVSGPTEAAAIADLGIRSVYDLRTHTERESRPDHLPDTANLVVADVLADDPGSGAASLGRIARMAASGDREQMQTAELQETFSTGYRSFVSLPSAQAASLHLLSALASSTGAPILVHCTAGKDRTGWLIALTLMAVGVSEDEVMGDYLASAEPVWEMFAPFRDDFQRNGGDIDTMRIALGVFPEYLAAALDELHSSYGSIDDYLVSGLGLTASQRQKLSENLLT
jgi:protein-tyrosine phosphatase